MNGRQVGEKRQDEATLRRIEKHRFAIYLRFYFESMYNKTAMTRWVYIKEVLRFIDWTDTYLAEEIWLPQEFAQIKRVDAFEFIKTLDGLSNSTKSRIIVIIKGFYDFLIKRDYIEDNPFNTIDLPKYSRQQKVTYLTKEEIKQLFYNIDNFKVDEANTYNYNYEFYRVRDKAIVTLMLSFALRKSSVVQLQVRDIDFEDNMIHFYEKGNKDRYVPMNKKSRIVLQEWLNIRDDYANDEEEALFVTELKGVALQVYGIDLIVKKYTKDFKKHISPHKLRATGATHVCRQTDIVTASALLGHANLNTTRIYVGVDEEEMKRAVNAMDDLL